MDFPTVGLSVEQASGLRRLLHRPDLAGSVANRIVAVHVVSQAAGLLFDRKETMLKEVLLGA